MTGLESRAQPRADPSKPFDKSIDPHIHLILSRAPYTIMIVPNIVIPLILTVNTGVNKFALGLDDASRFDRISPATSAFVDFVPEASIVAGVDSVDKPKRLRGFDGVGTSPNESTEIEPIDKDGPVLPAAKIGRSIRVGASARVSRLPE